MGGLEDGSVVAAHPEAKGVADENLLDMLAFRKLPDHVDRNKKASGPKSDYWFLTPFPWLVDEEKANAAFIRS